MRGATPEVPQGRGCNDEPFAETPDSRPDRGLLARRFTGWIWAALLAAAALLVWQTVVGWPLSITLKVAAPGAVRLPGSYRATDWENALVRVTRDGRPVTRYANQEVLERSTAEGYAVKGRAVLLQAGEARGPWLIRLPWSPRALWTLLVVVAAAAATIARFRARSPLVLGIPAPRFPWLTGGLAAAVFLCALALRAFGFSVPLWLNDTHLYFRSILEVMNGRAPLATPDRPFGYALVMGHLLRLFPDLRAIVAAHALATLVAASGVGGIIWAAAARLFAHPAAQAACRFAGVFAFAGIALNEQIAQREWALLSEAWVALYLGAQALLVWHLTVEPRPLRQALLAYVPLCALGLMTFFTRANWGFALAALPLPWLVATLRHARSRFGWLAIGAGVLLALAAAGFAFQAHCVVTPPLVTLSDRARALVCWHLPLVRPEIERQLHAEPPDPHRAALQEMAAIFDAATAPNPQRERGVYPSLGYDPDHLFFFDLPDAPEFQRLTVEQRTVLCSSLFWSGLKRDPGVYLRKVARQFGQFFEHPYQKPSLGLHYLDYALARSEQAAREEPLLPPGLRAKYSAEIAQAKLEYARPWPSFARLALSLRAVVVFEFLTSSLGWMLVLPLALLLAATAIPAWRRAVAWFRLAPVLTVAAWALASVLLSALTSAVTQGLDVQRYLELSMPLTLLAQVLWPLLAISLLGALVRTRPC